jgi:polyhydroxyalkanoate synthesis regulator protein
MAEERLIRKYANRRLYDAQDSRHVTLDDLRKLIRFYGNPIQQMLTSYLEQSIGGLLRQQNLMQQEMAKALETPMAPIAEMARQNMEMWAKMQASMLSAFTPTPAPGATGTPPPKPGSPRRRG